MLSDLSDKNSYQNRIDALLRKTICVVHLIAIIENYKIV